MSQPKEQPATSSAPADMDRMQFDAIRSRRRETANRVSEARREAVYRANHRDYRSALIQADALTAEARRLRQRIELEKLAYERLEGAPNGRV